MLGAVTIHRIAMRRDEGAAGQSDEVGGARLSHGRFLALPVELAFDDAWAADCSRSPVHGGLGQQRVSVHTSR